MEAPPGFEPGMEVLQTSALPLGDGALKPKLYDLSKKLWSGKRDSNPRLRPWQGRTLPLSYSRMPRITNDKRNTWVQTPTRITADGTDGRRPLTQQMHSSSTSVSIVFRPEYPQEISRDHLSSCESDRITKISCHVEQYSALQ